MTSSALESRRRNLMRNFIEKIASFLEFPNTEISSHVYGGIAWSVFFTHWCRYSKWFWLTLPLYVTIIVFRELYIDGHLKRILKKTESPEEFKDLKMDLFTKLIGIVGYGLGFFS